MELQAAATVWRLLLEAATAELEAIGMNPLAARKLAITVALLGMWCPDA